jgi:hypothetical protein
MLNLFRRRAEDISGFTDYIASLADPTRRVLLIDTYSYVVDDTDGTNITAAAPQEFDVVMDTDSTFVFLGLNAFGRTSTAPISTEMNLNPALSLQIKDQSSGRNYFNQPAAVPLIAGAGGFPFLFPSPRIVAARSTLTLTVAAIGSTAVFDRFYAALHGARIFYAGGA